MLHNRIRHSFMFMAEGSEAKNKTESQSSESDSAAASPPHQQPHNAYTQRKLIKYEETAIPAARRDTGDSADRDAVLARLEAEKILALIKAWEESEKTKVENRAYKMHFSVGLWEDSKKASVEAKLKRNEEKLERKKAEYIEKMQNKIAEIHRLAEEKRARVEAQKGKELLKIEDTAENFRTRGYLPRKLVACFGG